MKTGKRTTVHFFNGFNDNVLIHRPSVLKVTFKRVFFDRFQTQNGFESTGESRPDFLSKGASAQ
jgi:hypothetical protein